MGKIDDYIVYMMELVTNPKHGYDQNHRWGEDYDCSSSIITAVQTVLPVKDAGATYTGNMKSAFTKCGFRAIPYSKGMALIRGDILLNEKHHTAMFIGNGKIAQFSINEKGKTTGGAPGDQTGRESSVCNFYEYSKGWDYVLRYEGDNSDKEETKVIITMTELKEGSKGPEVKTLQVLLYSHGFNCGTADGDFGPKTKAALLNYQKAKGLKEDAICGKCTWTSILAS